jgi:putative transposase
MSTGALTSVREACSALGLPPATFYRWRRPVEGPRQSRSGARQLSDDERQRVLDVAHEPRFADAPPAQIVATLLEQDEYLCSTRTMYRILDASAEVRERRAQRVQARTA